MHRGVGPFTQGLHPCLIACRRAAYFPIQEEEDIGTEVRRDGREAARGALPICVTTGGRAEPPPLPLALTPAQAPVLSMWWSVC